MRIFSSSFATTFHHAARHYHFVVFRYYRCYAFLIGCILLADGIRLDVDPQADGEFVNLEEEHLLIGHDNSIFSLKSAHSASRRQSQYPQTKEHENRNRTWGAAKLFVPHVCSILLRGEANVHKSAHLYSSLDGKTLPLPFQVYQKRQEPLFDVELSWKRKLLCSFIVRPVRTKISIFRPYVDVIVYRKEAFWFFLPKDHHFKHFIPNSKLRVFVHFIFADGSRVVGECSFGIEDATPQACLVRRNVPFEWFDLNDENVTRSAKKSLRIAYTLNVDSADVDDSFVEEFDYVDEEIELISEFNLPKIANNSSSAIHEEIQSLPLFKLPNGFIISLQTLAANVSFTLNSISSLLLSYRFNSAPTNQSNASRLMRDNVENYSDSNSVFSDSFLGEFAAESSQIFRSNASAFQIRIEIDERRFEVELIASIGSAFWLENIEKRTNETTKYAQPNVTVYVVTLYPTTMNMSLDRIRDERNRCFLAILLKSRKLRNSSNKFNFENVVKENSDEMDETQLQEKTGFVRFSLMPLTAAWKAVRNFDTNYTRLTDSYARTNASHADLLSGIVPDKIVKFPILKETDYAIVPIFRHSDLINTAVLSGRQVSEPLRILSVSGGGRVNDVTDMSHCLSGESRILKTSPTCASVYVDGAEKRGSPNAHIHIQYGALTCTLRVRVWFPRLPLIVRVENPILHRVSNWGVFAHNNLEPMHDDSRVIYGAKGILSDRIRRASKRLFEKKRKRRRISKIHLPTECAPRFQQTEVDVLAAFHTVDPRNGESKFLSGDESLLFDVSRLVQQRVQSSNPEAVRLRRDKGRILATAHAAGTLRIRVQCSAIASTPFTSSSTSSLSAHDDGDVFDCGSASLAVTEAESVRVTALSIGLVTDVYAEVRIPQIARPTSFDPAIVELLVKARTDFFRQFQHGLLNIRVLYSDGHSELLGDLDRLDYSLRIFSTEMDALRVRQHFLPATATRRRRNGDKFMGLAGATQRTSGADHSTVVEVIAVRAFRKPAILSAQLYAVCDVGLSQRSGTSLVTAAALAFGSVAVVTSFEEQDAAPTNEKLPDLNKKKAVFSARYNDRKHGNGQSAQSEQLWIDDQKEEEKEDEHSAKNTNWLIFGIFAILFFLLVTVAVIMKRFSSFSNTVSGMFAYGSHFYRNCSRYTRPNEDDSFFLDKNFNEKSSENGRGGHFSQKLFCHSAGGGGFSCFHNGYNRLVGSLHHRIGSGLSKTLPFGQSSSEADDQSRFMCDENSLQSVESQRIAAADRSRDFAGDNLMARTQQKKACARRQGINFKEAKNCFGDVAVSVETARDGQAAGDELASRRKKFQANTTKFNNGRRMTAAEWVWLPKSSNFNSLFALTNSDGVNSKSPSEEDTLFQNCPIIESQYSRRSTLELNVVEDCVSDSADRKAFSLNSNASDSSSSFRPSTDAANNKKDVTVYYHGSEVSICIGRESSNVTVNGDKQKQNESAKPKEKHHRTKHSFNGEQGMQSEKEIKTKEKLKKVKMSAKRRAESYSGPADCPQATIDERSDSHDGDEVFTPRYDDATFPLSFSNKSDDATLFLPYPFNYKTSKFSLHSNSYEEDYGRKECEFESNIFDKNLFIHSLPLPVKRTNSSLEIYDRIAAAYGNNFEDETRLATSTLHNNDDWYPLSLDLNYQFPRHFEHSLPLPPLLSYLPRNDVDEIYYDKIPLHEDYKTDTMQRLSSTSPTPATSPLLCGSYENVENDYAKVDTNRPLLPYNKAKKRLSSLSTASPPELKQRMPRRLSLMVSSAEELGDCLNGRNTRKIKNQGGRKRRKWKADDVFNTRDELDERPKNMELNFDGEFSSNASTLRETFA